MATHQPHTDGSMMRSPDVQQSWDLFSDGVVAWAPPAMLAELYAPGLSAAVVDRLAASSRLAARHAAYVQAQLGTIDVAAINTEDRRLLASDGPALDRLALTVGAVWHAHRIRELVLSADVTALETEFGPDIRQVCIRYLAQVSPRAISAPTLSAAIRSDGYALRAAWIGEFAKPIQDRLILRLGGRLPPPTELHRQDGPRLVRLVAAEVIPA